MRAAFLTLGCKVNFYETEKMIEQFKKRGFEIAEFSETADIYVINTCTVTNVADRKSRQMIHRARKKNPSAYVVAVGCYVESGGDKVLQDTAIDAAFSNRDKGDIADRIIGQFQLRCDKSGADRSGDGTENQTGEIKSRTRAYIKIQDGCNQFCTYCIIPYVRGGGKLASTPPEDVIEQVEKLAAQGYKEVVLIGIHLSSYGVDRSEEIHFTKLKGRPLSDLIRRIADVPGIERIRLGSLEPRIITEEFLESLSEVPALCPHFHLSLQSGSDAVLRRMNRHYTTVEYMEKAELLRRYFDRPAITTDVIVGFPGETEAEFEQTRAFMEQLRLADTHVFQYSRRSGTKAAERTDQVSPEIKKRRSEILLGDVERYKREYGDSFLGKTEKVLFENTVVESGETWLQGHNERYVRIAVSESEARFKGWRPNQIRDVLVERIRYE